jgi:hypothetical protein
VFDVRPVPTISCKAPPARPRSGKRASMAGIPNRRFALPALAGRPMRPNSIIAFINPMTVMQPGAYGAADGHGGFIPGTTLIADACIPPLFGYQPYETGRLGRERGLYSLQPGFVQ